MEKRIFFMGIVIILLFTFYTTSLSYDGIDKDNIRWEKLLFNMDDSKHEEIECLNVEGKKYISEIDLSKIIGGSMTLKDGYILFKNYIDFPETDYLNGEIFIYASIKKINNEKREMLIEQHMDDNSILIDPVLKVREDVIIILERKDKKINLCFEDLKVGDRLGIVLDRKGLIRGIIVPV